MTSYALKGKAEAPRLLENKLLRGSRRQADRLLSASFESKITELVAALMRSLKRDQTTD
jgi:hypothetical protein